MSIKTFNDWVSTVTENLSESAPSDFTGWFLLKEDAISDALGTSNNSSPNPKVGWDPAIISMVESMSDENVLSKAETIIALSRLKIFENLQWFRPYWDAMPPTPVFRAGGTLSGKIGTMSTSGSAIFYCPRFVVYTFEFAKKHMKSADDVSSRNAQRAMREGKKWYNDYTTFVLVHEILHNSLKHFTRDTVQGVKSDLVNPSELQQLWNIAFDYEINRILKKMLGDTLEMFPGGVDHEEGRFKAPKGEEEFFSESTAERIFYRLLRELEKKRAGNINQQNQEKNEPTKVGIAVGDIVEVINQPGKYGKVENIDIDENNIDNSKVDIRELSKEEIDTIKGNSQNSGSNTGYEPIESPKSETEDYLDDLNLSEL